MNFKSLNIIALLVVAALLLSACSTTSGAASSSTPTPIPAVTTASGVVAEGHLVPRDKVSMSFAASGHVQKLLVNKGDHVQTGQIIAELDTAAVQQIAVEQAQRYLQELTSQASIAVAEQAVASARDTLAKAQDKADGLHFHRASDTLIDNTQGEIDLAKQQLARASDAYRMVARLPDGDTKKATALVAMTNAQLNLNNLIAKYNWYTGKPTDIDAAILQSNLDAAKANLQEAEWYLQTLKGGKIQDNATGNQLAELKRAKDDFTIAKTKLDGARLIAPFSGTITDINVSVGQFVGPETWVLLLADFSQWYVETSDLTEIAVVDITESQPAIITLDSLPDVTLNGKVVSIAQNFSEKQGDIVYKVTVLLSDQNPALRWGMTAEVKFQR